LQFFISSAQYLTVAQPGGKHDEKPRREGATTRSIAKAAQVSQSTVSLALRGSPKISEKARARILKIAKAHGYQPDPLASGVMSRFRATNPKGPETVAWLNELPDMTTWSSPSLIPFWHGILRAAAKFNFQIEPFQLGSSPEADRRLEKILRARGISCLALPGITCSPRFDLQFQWEHFSFVGFAGYHPHLRMTRVIPDDYSNAVLTIESLKKCHFKKPAHVFEQWNVSDEDARGPFDAALEAYVHAPNFRLRIDRRENNAASHFLAWYSKHQPDVIITNVPDVRDWLKSGGYHVPSDTALVSPCAQSIEPAGLWAGIDQRYDQIAEAMISELLHQILKHQKGPLENPRNILIPGKWIFGETLPAEMIRSGT